MSNLDDNQLALLAAGGRHDAFEQLYDRHCAGVARTLAPFAGGDRDTIDDLTQEVFVRVIKGLKGYKPVKPFTNWLFTVALNVGRNHARDSAKLKPVEPDELEQLSENADENRSLSGELVGLAAVKAAGRLPEHLRDILALRISGGMPYPEISEMTGIPEGTARRRMHDALNLLRKMLGLEQEQEEVINGQG
jgi:RNA polymerase sigma-70 factor (ECF subfamily)